MNGYKKFPLPKPVKVEIDIDEVRNLATETTTLPQLEAWNKEIIKSISECTSSRDVKTFLNILRKYIKFLKKDYTKCWDRVIFIKSIQRHVMAMSDYFSAHTENVKYEFDYVFHISKIIGLYCTMELEAHRNALSQVSSKCDFVTSVTNRLLGLMFVSLNFTSGRVSDVLLRIEYSRTNKFHSAVMTRLYRHCLLAIPLETTSYAAFYSYYLNFQDMKRLTPKDLRAGQKEYLLQSFGKSQDEVKDDLILKKILETPSRSAMKTVEHIAFPRKRTTRSYFKYLQNTQTCHVPNDRNITDMMDSVAITASSNNLKSQDFQNTFNFTESLLTSSESESESENENIICEIDIDSDFEEITYVQKPPPKRKHRHKKKISKLDDIGLKRPSFTSNEVIILDSSEEEEEVAPVSQVSASIFGNDNCTQTTFDNIEFTAITGDFAAPEFHHGLITPPRERYGLFDDNLIIENERECDEQGIFESYNENTGSDIELEKDQTEFSENNTEIRSAVRMDCSVNESSVAQNEIIPVQISAPEMTNFETAYEENFNGTSQSEDMQLETAQPELDSLRVVAETLQENVQELSAIEQNPETILTNKVNDTIDSSCVQDSVSEINTNERNVEEALSETMMQISETNGQLLEDIVQKIVDENTASDIGIIEEAVERSGGNKVIQILETVCNNNSVSIGNDNVAFENRNKSTDDVDVSIGYNNLACNSNTLSTDQWINGTQIQKRTEAKQTDVSKGVTSKEENKSNGILLESLQKQSDMSPNQTLNSENVAKRVETQNERLILEKDDELKYGKITGKSFVEKVAFMSGEKQGKLGETDNGQNLCQMPDESPESENSMQMEVDYGYTSEGSYIVTGGNDSVSDRHSEVIYSDHAKEVQEENLHNAGDLQSSEGNLATKVSNNKKSSKVNVKVDSPRVLYTSAVEEFDQFEARINQSSQIQQFSESYSEIDAFLSGPIESSRVDDQYYDDKELPTSDLFALVNNGLKGVLPHLDIPIKLGTSINKSKEDSTFNDHSTAGKAKRVTFYDDSTSPETVFDSQQLAEVLGKRGDSPTPSPVFEKWRKRYTGEFKKVLKNINEAGFSQFENLGNRNRNPSQDNAIKSVTFSDHVQTRCISPRPVLHNSPFVVRDGVKCFVSSWNDEKVFWDATVDLCLMTPAELRRYNVRVPLEHNTRTTCLLEKHEFRKSGQNAAQVPEEYNSAFHCSGRAESCDESYGSDETIVDDDRSGTPIPNIPIAVNTQDFMSISSLINIDNYLGSNDLESGNIIRGDPAEYRDHNMLSLQYVHPSLEKDIVVQEKAKDELGKCMESSAVHNEIENIITITKQDIGYSADKLLAEMVEEFYNISLIETERTQKEVEEGTVQMTQPLKSIAITEFPVTEILKETSNNICNNTDKSTVNEYDNNLGIEVISNISTSDLERQVALQLEDVSLDISSHNKMEFNSEKVHQSELFLNEAKSEEVNLEQQIDLEEQFNSKQQSNLNEQSTSEKQIISEQESTVEEQVNLEQQINLEVNVEQLKKLEKQISTEQQNSLDDPNIIDKEGEVIAIEKQQKSTDIGIQSDDISVIPTCINLEQDECNESTTKTIFETIHKIAVSLTSKEIDNDTKLKTLKKLLSAIIAKEDSPEKEDIIDSTTVDEDKHDTSTNMTNTVPLQAIAIQTDSECSVTTANEETTSSSVISLQAIAIQTELTTINANEEVTSTNVANVIGDKLILDMSKFNNTEFDVQAIKDAVNTKNGKFNEEAVVKVLVEISSAKNQLSAEPLQEDLIECLSGTDNKSQNVAHASSGDNLNEITRTIEENNVDNRSNMKEKSDAQNSLYTSIEYSQNNVQESDSVKVSLQDFFDGEHEVQNDVGSKTKHNMLLNDNTNISKIERKYKTPTKINKSSGKTKKLKVKNEFRPSDKTVDNISKLRENFTKKIKKEKSKEETNGKKTVFKALFGDSDDEMEIVTSRDITKDITRVQYKSDNYEKYRNALKVYDENCSTKTAHETKKTGDLSEINTYDKQFDLDNSKTHIDKSPVQEDTDNRLVSNVSNDEYCKGEVRGYSAKKITTHKRRHSESHIKEELKFQSYDDLKYKHVYNKFGELIPIEQPSVKLVDYLAAKKESISKDPLSKTSLSKDKLKHQKNKSKHLHKLFKLEKGHHRQSEKPESLATLSRNSLSSHKTRRKSVEEVSHKIDSIEDTKIRIVKCDSHESIVSPYTFSESNEKLFGSLTDYRNENIVDFRKELKSRRKSSDQKESTKKEIYDTSDTETADESIVSDATCISVKKQQCLNQVYNKNRHKSTETRVPPVTEVSSVQDNQKIKKRGSQGSRRKRRVNEDPLYRGQCANIQQANKICPYGTRQHWDLREYTLNEVIDIGRKGILGPVECLLPADTVTFMVKKTPSNNYPENETQTDKQVQDIEKFIRDSVEKEIEIENNSKNDILESAEKTIPSETVEYEPEDNLIIDETADDRTSSNAESLESSDNTCFNETSFDDMHVDIEAPYDDDDDDDDDDDSSRDLVICSDESRTSDTESSMDQTNLFNLNNVTNDDTNISPLLFDSNFYLSDQSANKGTSEMGVLSPETDSTIPEVLKESANPAASENRTSPSFAITQDLITAVEGNIAMKTAAILTSAQDAEETCFVEAETGSYYAERMDTADIPETGFSNSGFISSFSKVISPNTEIPENTNDNYSEGFEQEVLKRRWDYEDDDMIYWTLVKDKYMLPPKKRCRVSSANNQTVIECNYPVTQQDLVSTFNDDCESMLMEKFNINQHKNREASIRNVGETKSQEYSGLPIVVDESATMPASNNNGVPSVGGESFQNVKKQLLHSQQPLVSTSNVVPYPIVTAGDVRSHKMGEQGHSRLFYPANQRSSAATSSKAAQDPIPRINYDSDAILNYKCPTSIGQLPSYDQIFGKYNTINSGFGQPSTSVQSNSSNEATRTIDMEDPIQIMDDGSYKVSLTEEKVLRGEVNSMLRSEKNACYIMAVLTGNKDNVICPFDFDGAEDMKVAEFDTVCNYVLSVITQEFFQNCYNKSKEDSSRPKKNNNLSENGSYTAVKGLNCASAMIYRRLLVKCLRRLRPVFKTPAERKQMPHQLLSSKESPLTSMVQAESMQQGRILSVDPQAESMEPRPLPMEPPPPYTPSPTVPPPTPLPQNIVVKFINPFVHPATPTYSVPEIHVKLETSNVEEQSLGAGPRRRNCATFRIT